jgi:two-component system, NtrC family, sensor kinase
VLRPSGLRSEIQLTLTLLFGASLLLGGFLFLRFAEQGFYDQRLDQAISSTQFLTTILAERRLENAQLPALNRYLTRFQNQYDVSSWWLFDAKGLLLLASHSGSDTPMPARRLRGLVLGEKLLFEWHRQEFFSRILNDGQGGWLDVAMPVAQGSQAQGYLQVRFSLRQIASRLSLAQKWVFLYALGYGLVLTGLGLFLLHRNVVMPVKKLAAATQKITGGDLDASLVVEGPAEIADLAEGFNLMVSALKQSRVETEDQIVSLEKANREVREAQDQVVRSEKMVSVGILAAGMAHEIGNPLAALTGYLGLLKAEALAQNQSDLVNYAIAEADRIDLLVRELLDYASPGQRHHERLNLMEIVDAALEMLGHQGVFQGLEVAWAPSIHWPQVWAVRHRLLQVVVNLLLNAKDACPAGGLIKVTVTTADGMVCLAITDSGTGIATENLRQIFDPFFTTKEPGKGRGLGLAICQRIIEETGGRIEVKSQPQQGSTFMIFLPICQLPQ